MFTITTGRRALARSGRAFTAAGLLAASCGGAAAQVKLFDDVSATALPALATAGRTMDAEFADLNGDGRLDLVLATEAGPNVVLLRGEGLKFVHAEDALPGGTAHDSEDIAIADLDGDGDPDLVFVSEDTLENEVYLNDGLGRFENVSDRLPLTGLSNAVLAFDIDGDGDRDLLIGNKGQNRVAINDGAARFTDGTAGRLPMLDDITQDLELGDVDGDGDLDLLVGNEDRNRLLLNNGAGIFEDATEGRFPETEPQETREIDLADVDGDGDLDILCANVAWRPGAVPTDRLLLNDGSGVFEDVTNERMPIEQPFTLDIDAADLDGDGDLDLVCAHVGGGTPIRIRVNDGAGAFRPVTPGRLPVFAQTAGIDVETLDLDGDGYAEIYLANHSGRDKLLRAVNRG